jgi:polysaccharide biosynthesis/export protein
MALAYLKILPPAAILGTILASGCGPVSQNPAMIANLSNESARTSTSSAVAADINRNIAAAAMLQGSASSLDYQIGPEDLLEITLFNVPEANGTERQVTPRATTVRVSQESQISLPVVGEISVKGLTVSGLEQKLREAYDRYIHKPQVGVLVKEFRQRVSIIGAVQKPGVFELTGPKTIIEIMAMAGGVTDKAGTQVHIYRQGPNGRESHVIDLLVLASNASLINADNAGLITMAVQPGDIINVPLAGTFFVDGAVKAPGSYPLGRRYSLSQALATAGGVDRDLYSSDITIFRRGASGAQPINIDLNGVLAGSTIDPQIEADDVILVPTHTGKYVYHKILGQILGWGTSVGGVAARSGS